MGFVTSGDLPMGGLMLRQVQRVGKLVGGLLLPGQLTVRVRGMRISFDPRTDIGRAIRARGAFEATEIDIATALLMSHRVGQRRCILDVGANIGVHSLMWAHAVPDGRVVAIEPAPGTYDLLCANIDLNSKRGQIEPVQCAVCEREGEVEFFVAEDSAFSSMKDTRRKRIRNVIRIRGRTLDGIAGELGEPVGLVKIDVEGLEDAVLEGARGLLVRDRPVLFIEIYGGTNSNLDPERTVRTVLDMGYEGLVYSADSGLERYVRHDDARYNYFFIPKV
jgi:FkbM family methyltransferase